MIHLRRAIILAIFATFLAGVYWIAKSGGPCARYETREIEMTHQGKFNSGVRTHRIKVCVDRAAKPEDK